MKPAATTVVPTKAGNESITTGELLMRTTVAAAVACLTIISISHAADVKASIKKETSIPAQGLAPALRTLAADREIHLIFVSEDVAGRRTSGAVGDLTLEEALRQLLNDTELTYKPIDDHTISILPRGSAVIPLRGAEKDEPAQRNDEVNAEVRGAQASASDDSFSGTTAKEFHDSGKMGDKGKGLWQRLRLAQADSSSSAMGDSKTEGSRRGIRLAQAEGRDSPSSTDAAENKAALEEVVVTAQRTQENLQQAAVAITAVSGETLERQGVTELANLAGMAPALQVSRNSGPYTSLRLRGISSTVGNQFGDPAIAVNVDQVYQARAVGAFGQFFDLARVEVVKGPQGILYGRNATGGAINIITAAPILGEYSGYLGLDRGNYDQLIVNGAINLGLADSLAARVAFQSEQRDGFFSNDSSDADTQGVRGQLRWAASDTVDLIVRADYTKDDNHGVGSTGYCAGAPVTALPSYSGCPATGRLFGDPWTSTVDQQPLINPYYPNGPGGTPGLVGAFGHNEYYSASAELNWQVFGGVLTAIPAYHHDTIDYMFANGFNVREQVDHDQYTFEVRFASDQTQSIRYVVGAFYFDDTQDGGATYDRRSYLTPFSTPSNVALGVPAGTPSSNNTITNQELHNDDTSWAVFGNLTWALTDTFRLSAGLRYTTEKKETDSLSAIYDAAGSRSPYVGTTRTWASDVPDITPADARATGGFVAVGSKDWDNTSYRVGAEWDWREDALLYATVATGFKSGGFFGNNPADPLGISYDPEKVIAYTLGSKNEFIDNRLRVNLELFQYDYDDQQVGSILFNSAGLRIGATVNAGTSTIRGVELETAFLPWENTRLSADIQYLDAVYDSFLIPNAFLGASGNAASRCTPAVNSRYPGAAFANDCSGQQMVNAPEWTVNLGVEQNFPLANGGSIAAQIDTRWEDERELNTSYFLYSRVESQHRSNATLSYNAPEDQWSVTAYIRNIEDDVTLDVAEPGVNQSGIIAATLRPPRQYGLRFRVNF